MIEHVSFEIILHATRIAYFHTTIESLANESLALATRRTTTRSLQASGEDVWIHAVRHDEKSGTKIVKFDENFNIKIASAYYIRSCST